MTVNFLFYNEYWAMSFISLISLTNVLTAVRKEVFPFNIGINSNPQGCTRKRFLQPFDLFNLPVVDIYFITAFLMIV